MYISSCGPKHRFEEMLLWQASSVCFLRFQTFFFFWRAAAALWILIHIHANTHARSFSLIFEPDKILMPLLGKVRHTLTHAAVMVAGGCLAWLWVGEAVMTWAGQIGKPHLKKGQGKKCRAPNGRNRWVSVCVCVCVCVCVSGIPLVQGNDWLREQCWPKRMSEC